MSTACASGALYLHVPFCLRKCAYCDFASRATQHGDARMGLYADALRAILRALAAAGALADVTTAYVGGGTPTMLGEALCDLVRDVRAACPRVVELTCEANPESLDAGLAARLADAGATRVSLGVQSLRDDELRALGRAHDAAGAVRAMDAVTAAGLDLSCDVMCGIPLQTAGTLRDTLDAIVAHGACHVSVYPLMVEDGTPLERACSRGELPYPDDDAQASLMLLAADVLARAGLSRYEVASYARPGRACRHNEAYWTGVSYLGLGTAAASMLTPAQFVRLCDVVALELTQEDDDTVAHDRDDVARVRLRMTDGADALVRAVRSGAPLRASVETLTAREAVAEDLMLGMRMTRGVSRALLDRAARTDGMGAALDAACAQALARGLARRTPNGGLAPTRDGWLLGNELYGLFWGLAHEA